MDTAQFIEIISGQRRGLLPAIARCGLTLLTPFYGTATLARNFLYDVSLLRRHTVNVPVISVGNITTGGTGKTPTVAWLVQRLQQRGRHPAIVSRGYHSLDGEGNDEQRVLAQQCPGTPHVQDRDRVRAAQRCAHAMDCDVILLDDGFQHRRLARDLDVVLIDALNPWGYGHLLPRGLLRESLSGLGRADLLLLTRTDLCEEEQLAAIERTASRYTAAPIVRTAFKPHGWQTIRGEQVPLETPPGTRLAAFCGIGNPAGFQRTLASIGIEISTDALRVFPDHHHYSDDDVAQLQNWARQNGWDALLTTQKDLVKLPSSGWEKCEPLAMTIGLDITSGGEQIDSILTGLGKSRFGATSGKVS